MKSPFAGMDPFIEACGLWEDFHAELIGEIKRAVTAAMPPGYVARIGKRSYVVFAEAEGQTDHGVRPDVSIAGPDGVELRAFIEHEFNERFVEVLELQPERRLVTRIEVLSPSNKRRRSPGWKKYLRKRQALLRGEANLVEIDLLRGGDRMPMLDPWPGSPYTLLVAREERAPRCKVWPAFFDRPLPEVPVPLSRPTPDLTLALQSLVETIYERGRYHEDIDYARPLSPPLTKEQAAWLRERLRS